MSQVEFKMLSLILAIVATLSILHTASGFPLTTASATHRHHKLLQFIEHQHLTNIRNLQYKNVTELYVRVLELSQTLNILQESLVCRPAYNFYHVILLANNICLS